MAFGIVDNKYTQEEVKNIKYPKGSNILIIDGDTVAFRVASASDKKSISVESPNGRKKQFKNKTAWKAWAKEKGLAFSKGYKITEEVEAEPVSFCISTLKRKIKALEKDVNANYTEIYFGGQDNFRLDLPLPDKYKGQRDVVKPTHLKASQEYLKYNLSGLEIIGVETDDVVQQRLVQIAKVDGMNAFLATIDKDAKQVFDEVDYNIIDIRENKIESITGGFGKLYLNKAGEMKGDGFIWLMAQVFLRDDTDNYKMNSHYAKRYGEKSFYKDFKELKTQAEVLSKMKELWLVLLPDTIEYVDWKGNQQNFSRIELAELYFSCAYMRLEPNDKRTLTSFFETNGVELGGLLTC